jgi:hypothetical protein
MSRVVFDKIQPSYSVDEECENIQSGGYLMKPVTTVIIAALIVVVAVVGYLYYQRTKNDITISVPKIEIKP